MERTLIEGEQLLELDPMHQQAHKCFVCGGNDGDAPCAYPSEGIKGCLRETRLQLLARDWKETVITQCILSFIDWDNNDASKTLHNLIAWHVAVSLDPSVSSEARELINQGREEAARVAECGSFLHADAPGARFGKACAKAIRALKDA